MIKKEVNFELYILCRDELINQKKSEDKKRKQKKIDEYGRMKEKIKKENTKLKKKNKSKKNVKNYVDVHCV